METKLAAESTANTILALLSISALLLTRPQLTCGGHDCTFGLPEGSRIHAVEIRWPDHALSVVDGRHLRPDSWLTVVRRDATSEQPSGAVVRSAQPSKQMQPSYRNGKAD